MGIYPSYETNYYRNSNQISRLCHYAIWCKRLHSFSASRACFFEPLSACFSKNQELLQRKLIFVQSLPLSLIALYLRLIFIDWFLSCALLLHYYLMLMLRKVEFIIHTKNSKSTESFKRWPERCDHIQSAVINHCAIRDELRRKIKNIK